MKTKKPIERVRVRHEYMDSDYTDQLSEEEKAFKQKFDKEYYGATLDVDNLDNNLHNTPELKKDCQDRNNAQNRCVYGQAKAKGAIFDIDISHRLNDTEERDSDFWERMSDPNIEDALIEFIDSKREELEEV